MTNTHTLTHTLLLDALHLFFVSFHRLPFWVCIVVNITTPCRRISFEFSLSTFLLCFVNICRLTSTDLETPGLTMFSSFSSQILTQEDWNVVLYNGMASTSPWAALYFVALMTFGNYVLFNLLVAILVEGFQAEVRRWSGSKDHHVVPNSVAHPGTFTYAASGTSSVVN